MGRPKKDPDQRLKNITVGLEERDLKIVQRTMDLLGCSQAAAVRALIRAGARGPATSPFTPIEGIDE